MAVKIRLRRMGQKKNPIYRIIVADSRSPRNGRSQRVQNRRGAGKEMADKRRTADRRCC